MRTLSVVLFNLYILTLSLSFIINEEIYNISLLLSLFIFIIQLFVIKNDLKKYQNFYLVFFGFFGTLILGILLNNLIVLRDFDGLFKIIDVIGQAGIAILLMNQILSLKNVKFIYFLFLIFYLFHILIGSDPNNIYVHGSRNLTSVIIIFMTILYLIFYYEEYHKITFYPLIINIIICVWAIGRSGVLISIVLFIGVLFFQVLKEKRNINFKMRKIFKNKLYRFFGWSIVSLFIFILISNLSNFLSLLTKYRFSFSSIIHEKRFNYISSYLYSLDVKSVFFGFNVYESYELFKISNLHNSYLNAHMRMGIMFIIAILFILKMLLKGIKINFLYSLFLGTILLRGFTDTILFVGNFDFILYYLVFKIYYESLYQNESQL